MTFTDNPGEPYIYPTKPHVCMNFNNIMKEIN